LENLHPAGGAGIGGPALLIGQQHLQPRFGVRQFGASARLFNGQGSLARSYSSSVGHFAGPCQAWFLALGYSVFFP
jgi:hypothetical protein